MSVLFLNVDDISIFLVVKSNRYNFFRVRRIRYRLWFFHFWGRYFFIVDLKVAI